MHLRPMMVLLPISMLFGCANYPQDYAALTTDNETGYQSAQTAPNRYFVSFTGNANASDEELEILVLRRAAELTAMQGAEWFGVVDAQPVVNTYEPRPILMPARQLEPVYSRLRVASDRPGSATPYVVPGADPNANRFKPHPSEASLYRVSNRQLIIEIEVVAEPDREGRDDQQLYNAFTLLEKVAAR